MRTTLIIIAAVVLGVVTSIGAVVSGFFAPRGLDGYKSSWFEVDGWSVTTTKLRGVSGVSASLNRSRPAAAAELLDDPRLPWWCGPIRRPELDADHNGYMHNGTALGWPFAVASMEYGIYEHFDGSIDTTAYRIGMFWHGLLANIVLLGTAWYALICSPRAVRQARRQLRGWCAACGYDLRGAPTSVCSECGSDRDALRRRATRSAWSHGAAALVSAIIVAIPLVQAWHRTAEDAARFAGGGWFDEVLAAQFTFDDFIRRVQAIPEHEQVLASRLDDLSHAQFEAVWRFVVDLAMVEPRPEYLPLIDQVVSRARLEREWWPVMAYSGYPWSAIGQRIEALIDEARTGPDLGATLVNVVRLSWTNHPESADRDEAEGVLRQLVDGGPSARVEMLAAFWLFRLAWMDAEEARDHAQRIIERDAGLRDDPHLGKRWWEDDA